MINGRITPDPQVVVIRLGQRMRKASDIVAQQVEREAIRLTAYVKQNKLTDQVLHVRTGRLRRSITYSVTRDGDRVEATVGTNVKYARVHEKGFNGTVNVREHMCTRKGKTFAVRAHARRMNIPARPFLVPSLEENTDRIVTNIRKALAEAMGAAL